jgi:hypothetical protein
MATETILSPGVLLQEIDKSFITPGVDPSGLAIIGPTVKGPVEIPTYIKDYNTFKQVYGTTLESASNSYEYFTSLAVKNYFQNGGSSCLVTRVAKDADTWTAASSSRIAPRGTDSTGPGPFSLETLGKGQIMNSSGSTYTNGGLENGTVDNVRWEISNINTANGTFTLIIRRGDDTTAKPIVLESFTECSLDPLSENYIERKVGNQYFKKDETDTNNILITVEGEFPNKSKYVRVSNVSSSLYEYINPGGVVQTGYEDKLPNSGSGVFTGGVGNNIGGNPLFGSEGAGTTIQGLAATDYDDAINILKNKDEYRFKTLIAPGLTQANNSAQIDTIVTNTTARGDNLFVADLVDYGATLATVKDEASDLDTSFATSYWPWVLVKSTELGRNVWCPASTVIPGVYAKNDSLAAPWFAPAGLTRGGITNVVRVENKLSKSLRDDLYSNKINPLATFPGQGIVVFGQKTLQNAKSALDRVNVRRMLLDVKDTINGFSKSILFENNTEQTRDRFVRLATPYLESLVQRQGLYAFQVKMDGQNNTPDIIDENKLVGQVFLQPTKTAEFIVLDFTLTPTGASFTD